MKTIDATAAQMTIARLTSSGDKFPFKFSYALSLNASKLDPIAKAYHETRTKLLEHHANKDADGKCVMKSEREYDIEDMPALIAEIEKIDAEEVEVSLHKVHIDHWPAEIDVAAMTALRPMLTDEAPAAKK